MRTIIFTVLAAMISIGAASATPLENARVPAQQESSADWANG